MLCGLDFMRVPDGDIAFKGAGKRRVNRWDSMLDAFVLAQNHPRLGIRSRLEIECHSMRKDFNQSIHLHYLPIYLDRLPRLSSFLINDTRSSKSLTTAVWFSTRISRCAKRSQPGHSNQDLANAVFPLDPK